MLKKLLICSVKVYQKLISPIKGPSCRFYPTCSQYAIDAITKHGSIKGGYLAVIRILKCNPFHPGGHDPVK